MKAAGPMGEVAMKVKFDVLYPDKVSRVMTTPMGELTMTLDGKSGWMKLPMGVRDLPPSQVEEMYKSLFLDPMVVLSHIDSPDYTIYYYKDDKVNDRPVSGVIVKHGPTGALTRWFLDNETMMLLKAVTRAQGEAGLQDQEELYDDYRDVGGVKVAFKTRQFMDGKQQMELELSGAKFNTGLTDAQFKKPAQ